MKTFFALCALALTLSLQLGAVRPASAQEAELSATEILQKSLKTYAKLQSYRGTCAVTDEQVSKMGGGEPQHRVANTRAAFEFERGQRLSVKGQNLLGNSFEALSTLDKTWIDWSVGALASDQERKAARKTFGGLEDAERFDEITSELFSLTNGAASIVPTLLMGDSPGNPLRRSFDATLLPSQIIVGDDCYVVRHDFAQTNLVTTFWVDKQTFLLRRMQEEKIFETDEPMTLSGNSIKLTIFINDEAK